MIDFDELYKEQQERESKREEREQRVCMDVAKYRLQEDFKVVKEQIEKLKQMFDDKRIFKLGIISKSLFFYSFEVKDASKYPTLELLEIAMKINNFIHSCKNIESGLLSFKQNNELSKLAKMYYEEYQDCLFGIFQKYVYFSFFDKKFDEDPYGENTTVKLEFVNKIKTLEKL